MFREFDVVPRIVAAPAARFETYLEFALGLFFGLPLPTDQSVGYIKGSPLRGFIIAKPMIFATLSM